MFRKEIKEAKGIVDDAKVVVEDVKKSGMDAINWVIIGSSLIAGFVTGAITSTIMFCNINKNN